MSYLVRKSLTASNASHQSSMLLVCLWANGDHANQDVFTWNWKPHEQLACLFSEAVFISCQVNHINDIFNLLLMTEPFVHLFDELNWGGKKKKSQLKFVSRYNNRAKKHFNCFFMLFLFPIWHQISYQSIESSDPSINVPGPRRTVSKLKNETYHMFSNLHPGTTYLISVRARTAKGFGQTALTEITTNISGRSAAVGASVLSWATVRNLV